jgi:acetyl-CoA C-acetyltransferase
MREVAVVGAGMIPFGELFHLGMKEMIPDAVAAAIKSVDKGIERSEIEAAWLGQFQTSDGFSAGILSDYGALPNIPVTRIENACATGNDALRNAVHAVGGGYVDVALVVGADKTRESSTTATFWEWMGLGRDSAWDFPVGLVSPASFALHVARYLHETGATREHLARVAVKNHANAVSNPYAHFRFAVTLQQVLDAPMVADPFGLLDCCPQSDGAAALIIASRDVVDRYTDRPVWIRGFGLGFDRVMHGTKADLAAFPATRRAAAKAYAMAGIEPADVDVAELHDCFTGVEILSYEDLGFFEPLTAWKKVEIGATQLDGQIPVNPSGGLKAKGHPPGATGVAQCVEIVEQLRGEAVNQIDGARWGLTHNVGGPTAVSAVTIFEAEHV